MKIFLSLIAALFFSTHAYAEIATKTIEYRSGDAALEGYLAYDDSQEGERPGVLIVHDWKGVGPYVKARAEQLARLGYVAFCADIYGRDVRPTDHTEAAKTAGIYRSDRKLLRARVNAGLAQLREFDVTDAARVAAIGYCFGGTAVLELARSGADIDGVASFHGGLDTPNKRDAKNIKSKVLVLHGADDPNVPPVEVSAFEEEMRSAKVDWQLISYGNAVHSFTLPDAGNDPSKGAAYNKKADERSWEALMQFFKEIF